VEGRPTTHGIEILPLAVRHPSLETDMTVRTWDFGALTERCGAQRPVTYCDSHRPPDMLLIACWPELHAVRF
jgi:hypothetical protein